LKRNRNLLLFSMLLSVLFIGLGSKSSPLYPLNDWVDVHCFFTMGRGIVDGLVPYRDLYEQKGPILYFVYALFALLSRDSFVLVFLLEVVTYALFLFFSGLLAQLYLGKTRAIYFLLPVLGAAVVTSWSFTHGGSVEQHGLFMLVYGMYSVLRAIKEKRSLTFTQAFANGIFAGILLWVKYTALGFYIGLALFVLIWYLTDPALRKKLLLTIGQFLLGVAVVSVPVFLYFGIHGAIGDLFTVYFYNNIFLYGQEFTEPRIEVIWNCLIGAVQYNLNYGWLIWSGILFLLRKDPEHWKAALMAALCFAGLTVTTFWGGIGYDYYSLIFAAFCVFGLIVWATLLQHTVVHTLWRKWFTNQLPVVITSLILLVSLMVNNTLQFNQNIYLMAYSKEDTVQYRFAKIIQTVDDPTLLNYGFLDGGFYYASGATPACRYFCYLNIDTQEMWDEQNACIQNGETDFIVTRYYTLEQYYLDMSHYELVDQFTHPFDKNYSYTYYLYQKIT